MRFHPSRAVYFCVFLLAFLLLCVTFYKGTKKKETAGVQSLYITKKNTETRIVETFIEQQNIFPISGTYSDIDNLKDNFILKSRTKSKYIGNAYMMHPNIQREQRLAMSFDSIIKKDMVWNEIGNVLKIGKVPNFEDPNYLNQERALVRRLDPNLGIINKERKNETYVKLRDPDVRNVNNYGEAYLRNGRQSNIFPNNNAFRFPIKIETKYQNIKPNPNPNQQSYSQGFEPNFAQERVQYMEQAQAHGIPIHSVKNIAGLKYESIKVPFNSLSSRYKPEISNKNIQNFGLAIQGQVKVPMRNYGNMGMASKKQIQNSASVSVKPNKHVIEIFPRKNEPIRIPIYMDHKGNFSYHHVNLMWEDGQRNPVIPLILKQNDVTKLMQQNKDDVKYTLIMTYMRSGSTITSELLKTNDTFFFFEPFQGLYRDHRTNQHVCYPHGYCRKPEGFWETIEGSVRIIKNLFTCKFMDIPVGAIEPFRIFSPSSYQKEFRDCFPVKKIDWDKRHFTLFEYPENYNKTCIQSLQVKCLGAKHRLIKTIRMPATFAESFLANIPNLKIVHLVRDPRGVMNSRVQIHLVKYDEKEIGIVSNHLCSRIWLDIQAFKRLQRSYPTQIIPFTYDCLALYPEDVARMLYKSLDLVYTPEKNAWVDMAFRNNFEQSFELFKHGQSSSLAQKWRISIPQKANEKVNKMCGKVLEELGLRRFTSPVDMRNLKNPVFIDSREACLNR
ncbi:uncharacterized protein LOC133195881 [Saccostrea echinata]|uniref:uncharacterized protein LOC133195881 n=1 Tax=Saccostrea echinata TaxID=191078 RepID=UPI002A81DCAE|nr:uncharacterized protein LOC133195881 [Saccostrea echinata]XP_061187835.1 uncharacterized protein LOC133195881 [Saccostrea echinata]XP_061187836.1 uncharacterized protein LOC133195881 [Saccostrea echinata]